MSATPTAAPRLDRRELAPALIVALIGIPLVFMFARAMADGEQRRRQAPLRALLGDETYEQLARGQMTEQNYLGNSLLAPDFVLSDKNGKPWRLSDQRGKLVVMNFWTITCPPCIEELPSIVELAKMAQGRDDMEVVAVSTDKNWQEIASVVPNGSTLRILFDPDRRIVSGKYGTRLFPETWVIDPRGVIRLRVDGKREWSDALAVDVIQSFL